MVLPKHKTSENIFFDSGDSEQTGDSPTGQCDGANM